MFECWTGVLSVGWQGEGLDAYKEFKDIEVKLANTSSCQVVLVTDSTKISCDLPVVDEDLLNDDGDALVQVLSWLRPWPPCCICSINIRYINMSSCTSTPVYLPSH